MTPDNGRAQTQFSEKRRKAQLETTNEGMQNKTVQEEGGERSRREVSWAWGWWSEVLNHLSVCQQKGKSRSGWWDAESGDVEILNSVIQTLTLASSLFFPYIYSSSSFPLTAHDCPSSTAAVVCHYSCRKDSFLFSLDCLLHENDGDLCKLQLLLFLLKRI